MKNKLIVGALLGWVGMFHFHFTALGQPVAATLAATSIGQTNATLNGTVNPNGNATVAYFQFGLTTNYDNLGGFLALPANNTTQTLPGLMVNSLHSAAGANWTPSSVPATNCQAVAYSADGTRLAAVVNGGGIYISTNSGGTWAPTSAPATNWQAIASSADGTRLVAAESLGGIYTSTDGGVTWTLTSAPSSIGWLSIVSSADGTRLAALTNPGGVYTSTNGGATWVQATSTASLNSRDLASSADGLRLAEAYIGGIDTSTNGGITWTQFTALNGSWYHIASSADGLRLAAVYNSYIYTSTNGGVTWTPTSAPTGGNWFSIASSADGTRLTAGGASGIYTSTDGGVAWTQTSTVSGTWNSIASSADGTQLAAVYGGGIYTSTGTPTTLAPGTTYHYRVVGLNSNGYGYGNDLTFTTLSGAPTATTLAAVGVNATNATLRGSVTTGGSTTTAYFQYGLTTAYGNYSATNTLTATNVVVSLSNQISNLLAGTTYHFQLVASNSSGVTLGNDLVFTTGWLPPLVTTLPATGITTTNATINGTVNPNGLATQTYFQYGLTTNYDNLGESLLLPATGVTQNLPGLLINSLHGPAGANWTLSSAPGTNWQSIVSSADGTRLAAGGMAGIYTSTNSGATWAQTSAAGTNWYYIASSADGSRLAALTYYAIYTSTDGGGTWTKANAPSGQPWQSIASSADGTRLAAVSFGGGIYTSTDSGATWALTSAPNNAYWHGVVSSSDGTRLAAVVVAGGIYTSMNSGSTWTLTSAPNGSDWYCIASSTDGTRLAAGDFSGPIYTSTNRGSTWTATSSPNLGWTSIASSADGMRLAAMSTTGLYTSTNGGVTWRQTSRLNGSLSQTIASSADGTQLAAVGANGSVYTSTGPTNNLAPGTTYHYRAVGINNLGTGYGSDLTFTTGLGVPTATTLAASGVTTTNATLNGSLTTGGLITSAYFQYGSTANYGSYTATNTLAATNVVLIITNLLGSLALNTNYHFQLVASNSAGTALGGDITFATILTPIATTLTATGITSTNATLNGTVNPNGGVTLAYDEYGLTMGYGLRTVTNILTATNVPVSVAILASNLSPGTTYHFLQVAINSAGANVGSDQIFTTSAGVPTISTLPANGVGTTNATLNGSVFTGELNTSAFFQYGLTTNYGSYSTTNALLAASASVSVSNSISDLSPFTTYHFQLVASNSAGIVVGNDLALTTLPATTAPPIATTLPATSITFDSAVLNGSVNPMGYAIAFFEYGLTTNYDNLGPVTVLPATNVAVNLSGLTIASAHGTAETNWTQASAPSNYWNNIAASVDGTRLAATYGYPGGGIYLSTNSGATWTRSGAPAKDWFSIASSADGMHLTAGDYNGGYLYTSTDGGNTWTTNNSPAADWVSIASSPDGSREAAAAYYNGGVFTSTNGGNTWNQTSFPLKYWLCLTSSADGRRIAAVNGIAIYVSADGGATWTNAAVAAVSIACSADGMRMAAVVNGGGIYLSTDGGYTWTISSAPNNNWHGITTSADGTRLIAVVDGGGIYTSSDSGVTWTAANAPAANWYNVACSADGTQLSAVSDNSGGIYTSGTTNNLSPGTTYHFRLVGLNSFGYSYGNDLTFTTSAFNLTGATRLPGGAFQFSFTNFGGLGFTVLATTNLMTPLSNWTELGAPVEAPPGQYQFTDPQATKWPARFYRVRSP